MVELKTLKEMQLLSFKEDNDNSGVFEMFHNTRQGLIKWIKDMNGDNHEQHKWLNEDNVSCPDHNDIIIEWIKHFGNITEKDLK